MTMCNPPHPGCLIEEILVELDLSIRGLSEKLNVSPSTLQRVVSNHSSITPEMAIRLSAVIGSSPEMWLGMQDAYDLWKIKDKVDVSKLHRIQFA